MSEHPAPREEFGFRRTECGCAFCQAPCRHLPGALAPADVARLCPPNRDVFAWAEEHLRVLLDRPVPTLVPARRADGACHWYHDGRCAVHFASPYGCAFFDCHMSPAEADRRAEAVKRARAEDAAAQGLYYRVWLHLKQKGLVGRPGERSEVIDALHQVRRQAERNRRRVRPD